MANEWFVQRDGTTTGPFSSQQLRQLASSGQLAPADLIRKGTNGHFVPAERARGLFPQTTSSLDEVTQSVATPNTTASVTAPTPNVTEASHSDSVIETPSLDQPNFGLPVLAGVGLGLAYGLLFGGWLFYGVTGGVVAAGLALTNHDRLSAFQFAKSPARFCGAVVASFILLGFVWAIAGGSHNTPSKQEGGFFSAAAKKSPKSTRADFVRNAEALVLQQGGMARVDSVSPPIFDMHGKCLQSFLDEFGNPDRDVPDEESSVMRYWVYNTNDGPVIIHLLRQGMGWPSDKTRPFRLLSKRDFY